MKEYFIKKAYGEHYERVKESIDIHGFIHSSILNFERAGFSRNQIQTLIFVDVWRPIELHYIW